MSLIGTLPRRVASTDLPGSSNRAGCKVESSGLGLGKEVTMLEVHGRCEALQSHQIYSNIMFKSVG